MPMETQSTRIGARLRAARDRAGLTQQALATALGFEHRQTLASIESGERRLSAVELLEAVRLLGVDLDFFTDTFRLVEGEGRFSFRARPGVSAAILDQFEERAGRWIATYRELGTQQGDTPDLVGLRLALHPRSTFEEAHAAAESIAVRWDLGPVPAASLREAMERHLNALVLHVDAPPGISGAASQLPGLNTVLVNRREPEGRRHYDLAHELFHLLTWDAMPPDRIEAADVPRVGKGNRVEQLAENFAGALLMPAAEMLARAEQRDPSHNLNDWLSDTAAELHVSAVACKWRLHNLGCLSRADLFDVDDQRLAVERTAVHAVRPFSERFMQRIAVALDAGRLSAKRAASLLAISLAELSVLLRSYGIDPAFEA